MMRLSRIIRDRANVATPVIRLSPQGFLAALCIGIATLTVLSTVAGTAFWVFRWPEDSLGRRLVNLFWLDSEHNVPTLYQVVTLCIAASLLLLVARELSSDKPDDGRRWRVLGFMFLLLAIDEGARIHERVDGYLFRFDVAHIHLTPAAIYLPVLTIFGLWFLPLLRRINSRTRLLLISSGLLYVGGALCVDALSLWYARLASKETILYAAMATLEEVCEMAGVALLIYTLLEYLGQLQAGSDI